MTREEAMQALNELATAPAARWIGNKPIDGGRKILQKCTRCGAEETLELPAALTSAFRRGARSDALAAQVPPDFDAKLFAWKKAFQRAHEGCVETAA